MVEEGTGGGEGEREGVFVSVVLIGVGGWLGVGD